MSEPRTCMKSSITPLPSLIDLIVGRKVEYISNPLLKLQEDPSLHICSLSHIDLDNEGCRRLFTWLRTGVDLEREQTVISSDNKSEVTTPVKSGFPRRLSHLELNDVQMSDTGFQHLIEWLQALQASNQNLNPQEAELKTIILRANSIEGTSASATAFIDALPSTVSTLVLSNNPLSSAFRQSFFSMLHNLPHLNRLLVSMTGMDIEDAEILASYIGSKNPRCTLIELKASGNSLQYEGLTKVTNAMKVCWSIEKVDLFGNCVTSALSPDFEAFEADTPILNDIVSALSLSHDQVSRLGHGSGTGVPLLDRRLIVLLARNIHLKKEVQREAFNLLKYSRLMLRKSIINPTSATADAPQTQLCNDCDCMSIPGPFLSSAILGSSQTQTAQFSTLPIEIQLDILSHLAPHLSTQQRIRIFEYAVDRNTLPRLQLCLPTFKDDPLNPKNCIVDPGSLQFLNFQNATGINPSGKKVGTLQRRHPHGVNLRSGSSCASGQCMASHSVLCQRQVERERWLQLVGCESYDPGE